MGYFLALDIPDHVVPALDDFMLPRSDDVRVQRRADLHITLAYIGSASEDKRAALMQALQGINLPNFNVKGAGALYFGPGPGYRNHFFTAQIELTPELQTLKDAIDAVCLEHDLAPRRHENAYNPHITLARADLELAQDQIDDFVRQNKNKTVPEFNISSFALYTSRHPGPYLKVRDYPLNG